MNTAYSTLPRIVRREHETAYLVQVLADINEELATMPDHKIGTQACLDRMAERTRLLRTLCLRGVLN